MSELKPCPFCGIEVINKPAWGKEAMEHPNNNCILRNKPYFSDDWNNRHPDLVPLDESKLEKFLIDYTDAERQDREMELILNQKASTATEVSFTKNSAKIACYKLALAICQTFASPFLPSMEEIETILHRMKSRIEILRRSNQTGATELWLEKDLKELTMLVK